MSELKESVRRICKSGADALILQDLGVLRVVKDICPDIEPVSYTHLDVYKRQRQRGNNENAEQAHCYALDDVLGQMIDPLLICVFFSKDIEVFLYYCLK